jgi:DNA-directed DNA polymerase III PolC
VTHLHVHSHYTFLGATPSVAQLVAQATAQGMGALALTDTNGLYGAPAFQRACLAAGIQPIVGMTVTVAPPEGAQGRHTPGELVLLATDRRGWQALCGLSSAIQARPDREAVAAHGVDWETLRNFAAGVICLAGGRRSWLGRALAGGDAALAARYAGRLGGLYGDNLYLALEVHGPPDNLQDLAQADALVEIGKRFGLPLVAAQPVYCLAPDERPRLTLLAALAHNCTRDAVEPAWQADVGDPHAVIHWQTPDEMGARFAAYPQALAAIATICGRCEPALPDGRPIWPVLPLGEHLTADAALRAHAEAGMGRVLGARLPTVSPTVAARLDLELAAIAQRGVAPLFLLMAELTAFARRQEIPYATRGSVANSLVAYCTGITSVDPVAHDLLFERFLNPAREDLPDIDLDLCSRRRDEVLHYVRERYGADRVALVATIATLRPKSAVRETAKAYGLDDATIVQLMGKVQDEWHPDPRRRRRDGLDGVLAQLDDPTHIEMMRAAFALVGTPHHLSIHPGGVVVAPGPMTEFVPVQWTPKGFWVTQFPHEDVEAIGLPKIDLLGIRALTVLADAAELVRRHHDPTFRPAMIPPDDARTASLLAQGETIGVFQCESSGAQRTLRQLRVQNVGDLAVANAFFKPGPATGGMAQAFIRRYRGEEPMQLLHPSLGPILGATQGVLLFQEQVLRVAVEIAGLSWGEADQLRKGMSKFRAADMAALQARFVDGCCRAQGNGALFKREQAETLWAQVMAFAGYGFNQGHATAYADVSYRSAYLKAHWPAEFLAARLADWGGFHHQAVYVAEARRLGIDVRPPHVNWSRNQFTLAVPGNQTADGPVLWMGLGQVRDLRRATVRALLAARRQGQFHSVTDLRQRVTLARKEWTHLVQCGALDGLGESRAAMLQAAGRFDAGGELAGSSAFWVCR